jgi:NAD:arginine ADP-ribosyltransferase
MAMQSGENSRFSDLCDEPVDHLLSPIKGYQDKPLVSLTDAIKPVSVCFKEIEDNVFVALHNCQNPADGLDQQESASIHLYTMQFDDGPSLYLLLNQSLRAENRDQLKPWFLFLKLFLTSLYKLPSQCKTVWRGVRDVDLSSTYKKGTKFAWWGVSSCTTDIEVLESDEFLGKHGLRTIFSIECINGKSIGNHSYFKNTEKEIILMPGSYFEVIGQLNPAPELHFIQLKEISPPITLVKPPFSTSTNINPCPVVSESNTSPQPTLITQNTPSNAVSKEIPWKSSMNHFYILK